VVVPCGAAWGTRCDLSLEPADTGRANPKKPGAGHLSVASTDVECFGGNRVGSIKTSASPLCGDHDSWRARTRVASVPCWIVPTHPGGLFTRTVGRELNASSARILGDPADSG
jgi:hypothetical protein